MTKPRKGKENVSPETLRQRRNCITGIINRQFGLDGEDYLIGEMIRRKGKEERADLLQSMGLRGEMSEEEGLAMMVDLGATGK